MKKFGQILFVLMATAVGIVGRCAAQTPVEGLAARISPALSGKVTVEILDGSESFFELSTTDGRLNIKADCTVSAAFGLGWYLRRYCLAEVGWCGDSVDIADKLPPIDGLCRRSTDIREQTYLNYCTFSYSTAFWDWPRWEREIDLMALGGVTMPLAMVGAEVVWRNTLRRFGFTDGEIADFLCGPTYFGWLLMGNLENIGSPLPDEWFDRQIELQQKIVGRMREYGMKPIFQGFYGAVPSALSAKYPEAHIVPQGDWCGLRRPPVLAADDKLFEAMSAAWYDEYALLFGEADYFGGDLFHEGGRTEGIDVPQMAAAVQKNMLKANPDAKWVLQAWQGNPKPSLLRGLDRAHTLIVDLGCETQPEWRREGSFGGFDWIWSHISNYGGNTGIYGRIDAMGYGFGQALACVVPPVGTGSTPEAIEHNPLVFEFASELRWCDGAPDVAAWIDSYAERRYGTSSAVAKEAWQIFYRTAYGSYDYQTHTPESVFCARPSLAREQITASAWGQCRIDYSAEEFERGVELLLSLKESLQQSATYRYDAVDFTRQVIANRGREQYYSMVDAYNAGDKALFGRCSRRFLELIEAQDRLLSTTPLFFVGTWLDHARACVTDTDAQRIFEQNARRLITTWTVEPTSLNDYSAREWGGLLRDYYLVRWKSYVAYLDAALDGSQAEEPDFDTMARRWIDSADSYALSTEDAVAVAAELFERYRSANDK